METARATFRPGFAAVLALAAGGYVGSSVPEIGPDAWRAAVLASFGLAVASALALRRTGAAQRIDPSRARAAAVCVVLAALGGARARDAALVPAAAEGRFEPRRVVDDAVRGTLAPGRLEIEVGTGLLEAGELVRVLGGTPAAERARGPVAAPAPRSDAPRVLVLPDELVRVAPPPGGAGPTMEAALAGWRATLRTRLERVADPEARGLVAALVLGDLSGLDPEVPDLFVRTGTIHALAVSGVQVVLVAAVLLAPLVALAGWLARRAGTRRARWAREVARAAALAVYVPIAGAGAPVARAALAFALARVAPLVPARRAARVERTGPAQHVQHEQHDQPAQRVRLARRADGLALWSLALFVECAVHPRAAADLSVQLSYAATLGLVLGTAPLRATLRLPKPAPVDALGRARSPYARALRTRAQHGVASALAASTAAVAATLPFVWWRLGEWSPLGVVATLAIAAPGAALLVLGWVAALAPGIVPDVLLTALSRALLAALRAFDALPGSPDALAPRPFALVALAVALGFAAFVARTEIARVRCARAAALIGALLLLPWTTAPRRLEVHALDVGHGTCCLVRAPGLGTWVFDAGSRDRAEVARAALGPALRAWEPGRIGVALSHPDRDHDGALPWLVSRFDVAVYAGALPAQVAERLPHTSARFDLPGGRAALPALQGSCQGVAAWLERGDDVEGNEGSRTLRVDWFGETFVLCGDAEAEGLRAWLDRAPPRAGARLLLAPHHGSEIERLGLLLDELGPREVWVSGAARPPIAAELERRRIPWRSTGAEGPLRLELDPPPGAACWNGMCLPDSPPERPNPEHPP